MPETGGQNPRLLEALQRGKRLSQGPTRKKHVRAHSNHKSYKKKRRVERIFFNNFFSVKFRYNVRGFIAIIYPEVL